MIYHPKKMEVISQGLTFKIRYHMTCYSLFLTSDIHTEPIMWEACLWLHLLSVPHEPGVCLLTLFCSLRKLYPTIQIKIKDYINSKMCQALKRHTFVAGISTSISSSIDSSRMLLKCKMNILSGISRHSSIFLNMKPFWKAFWQALELMKS